MHSAVYWVQEHFLRKMWSGLESENSLPYIANDKSLWICTAPSFIFLLARCQIYKRAVYILNVYIFMQIMLFCRCCLWRSNRGQILYLEFQNYINVSLVFISSDSSKISLQAFQFYVKIRCNIREYNKEEV